MQKVWHERQFSYFRQKARKKYQEFVNYFEKNICIGIQKYSKIGIQKTFKNIQNVIVCGVVVKSVVAVAHCIQLNWILISETQNGFVINGKQTAKGLQDERADVRRHLEPSDQGVRGVIAPPHQIFARIEAKSS